MAGEAEENIPTLLFPRRAAHAAIYGYLYQTLLGVERWFQLGADEALRCEGDEDLDRLLLDGSGGVSEQVKALTGGINIRDEVVKGTLRRFLVSHSLLRQAGDSRSFVLTTTASLRRQRGDDLQADILAEWSAAREEDGVRARIVADLRKLLPIPDGEGESDDFRRHLAAALDWLDADPERWGDLIRSVEWRLDQPDLAGVRRRLLDRLAQRGLPADLLDRLVAEILQASMEPDPRKRIRTTADLESLLRTAEADLTRWVATGRAASLRRAIDEIAGARRWLSSRHLELERISPSKLLTANYEVVEFNESGRLQALEALAEFCNGPRDRDLWVVHGDGGLGKTRLLMEGCRRLAAQGWHAGFLDPDAETAQLAELMEGLAPRLIVVDYAESRLPQVQILVRRMARTPLPGVKVRTVLLARRDGDWIETLRRGAEEIDLLDRRFPSLELPPLNDEDSARWPTFDAAVDAFAHYLGVKRPTLLSLPNLRREAFGRPLYLHMAALIAAEGTTAATEEALLAAILDRERRFWQEEIESSVPDFAPRMQLQQAMEPLMAALSLFGGLPAAHCRKLAHRLLGDRASEGLAEILIQLARRFYAAPPGSAWYLEGLEPDLLGEELVRQALLQENSPLLASFDLTEEAERRHALSVLGRLAQPPFSKKIAKDGLERAFAQWLDQLAEPALDVAVALGDPIGQVLAPLLEKQASFDLAFRLMMRCDRAELRQSVPLREVALAATQKVHGHLRAQMADARPEIQDQFARCATQLGIRLSEASRPEQALEATQEAVAIYRSLALEQPEVFLPRLALSLTNLGMRLSDLGRLRDALEAAQEAVEIRRRLSEIDPLLYHPKLATSLNNLGFILNRLKRSPEALLSFQEAVAIRRQLARNDPDTHDADLARSLSDLALCHQVSDQPQEALDAITQAEILYRRLAAGRPDAFLPDLARSLNSMGLVQRDLGWFPQALEAIAEAESIFGRLALVRPDAFEPELAEALNSRGTILSRAGSPEQALRAVQDAVAIYRRRHNAMVLPRLAVSLTHLSDLFGATEQPFEAWEATNEAMFLLLPLFRNHPEIHQGTMQRLRYNYERFAAPAGFEPDPRVLAMLDHLEQQLET